jgi:hypothetical protein
LAFVDERTAAGKDVKYINTKLGCRVMTAQETDLTFHFLKDVFLIDDSDDLVFESEYYLNEKLGEVPYCCKNSLFA